MATWCYRGVMIDTRTTLRLPPELDRRVRQLADRERRSIHAQLLVLIERGLEAGQRDQEEDR